jgi:orotate phosphoribosyltransferase
VMRSKVPELERPDLDEITRDQDDIARILLATGAVTVATEERYRFGSGLPSPMYVDNRRLLSMVGPRRKVCDALRKRVGEYVRLKGANVVVGVPTGGLPWAAWLSEDLSLPLVYVRSAPKDRGLGKQIEGVLPENALALVLDDLVTTGQSSEVAIRAITAADAEVCAVVSIFSYGVPFAARLFGGLHVEHFTVTDLAAVLRVGVESLTPEERHAISVWREHRLMPFEPDNLATA